MAILGYMLSPFVSTRVTLPLRAATDMATSAIPAIAMIVTCA